MGYTGMCRCEGYGFQAVYSRIGYINQRAWVQNRVSFFRKLISWVKILSRLGKQLLQDRGIWGVYSSIGQQNSAELALVQVKGSRVPATHPHPEIPKVPPPPGTVGSRFSRVQPVNTLLHNCLLVTYHANKIGKECCFRLSRRLWGEMKNELP